MRDLQGRRFTEMNPGALLIRMEAPENEREVEMFHVIWIMIVGLIVGVLAKLIMPGRDPGGILVTMLLGIAGSLVGGLVGRLIGFYGPREGAGFIVSILGAILLLWLYRVFVTNRRPTVGLRR